MPLSPQIVITPETVTTKNFDISAVTYTSTSATYTATGHTFNVGDSVLVSGLAPDGFNGNFTVTAKATNTFTVANSTNAAVTDAVGSVFWTDPNEFEFTNYESAYLTDNNDVNALISTNPSLAQALADAASALSNAASANAAATSAALQAGIAQTAANGKNKVTYSGAGPSGGGVSGDIWFQLDGSNNISAQYIFNGSSWTSTPISSSVIANLDAGKITSGQLTSISISNGNGTFSVTPAGDLVASSAKITGEIIATSGKFTGEIQASTGKIGGWTIEGARLFSGSSEMNSSTGNAIFTGVTAFGQIYGYGSLYATTTIEAGTSIKANGKLYAAGYGTTGNTANTHMFSNGEILRNGASSQRYKENIVNIRTVPELDPKKLLDIPVRAFSYKSEYLADDDRAGVLIPGLIAEEVDAIYPLAADYENGQVENINDRAILINLLALVQDLYQEISILKGE